MHRAVNWALGSGVTHGWSSHEGGVVIRGAYFQWPYPSRRRDESCLTSVFYSSPPPESRSPTKHLPGVSGSFNPRIWPKGNGLCLRSSKSNKAIESQTTTRKSWSSSFGTRASYDFLHAPLLDSK
ncbi:hypothetical protein C8R44DRAFT_756489 [Mycena epipterygia]|nr:hypothetical protein C8R44DRAFT_756489 [Mycena epipterygia]